MIQSPLNYTGGKYKLLPQILPLFPKEIDCFVDLFCGGCNVGMNVVASRYVYNDYNEALINLFKTMQKSEAEKFVESVNKIIQKYNLSDVKVHGYDYYCCNSSDGLGKYNKDKYIKLRTDFNLLNEYNFEYYCMLYVLIVYSFNNQIRFNKNGEFNLPVGKRDFNKRMNEKLVKFIDELSLKKVCFENLDFREINLKNYTSKDFFYVDPPYLITCAGYNEQGGWSEKDECELLGLLDRLSSNNIRFALSNVLESKGKMNNILFEWIKSRPKYKLIDLDYSYGNSNYQRRNKNRKSREVLIINY